MAARPDRDRRPAAWSRYTCRPSAIAPDLRGAYRGGFHKPSARAPPAPLGGVRVPSTLHCELHPAPPTGLAQGSERFCPQVSAPATRGHACNADSGHRPGAGGVWVPLPRDSLDLPERPPLE